MRGRISQVCTADPRIDPGAKPLDRVPFAGFRCIAGDECMPGKNGPSDPVAAKRAASARRWIMVAGADLANFERIPQGEPFAGAAIGPE